MNFYVGLYAILLVLLMGYQIIKLKQYKTLKSILLIIAYSIMLFSIGIFIILWAFGIESSIWIGYLPVILLILIFAYVLTSSFNQEHHDLIKLKNELEQRVDERTAELKQSKTEVELLSQQKTNFFINISHEIRTPLTLLKSYLDKYINKIKDKKDEDLQIIVKSYNKLERDILNFITRIFTDYYRLTRITLV